MRRTVSNSRLFWLVWFGLCAFQSPSGVRSQRAIVSLGQRIQQKLSGGNRSNNSQEKQQKQQQNSFLHQGEANTIWEALSSTFSSQNANSATATAGVVTLLLLFVGYYYSSITQRKTDSNSSRRPVVTIIHSEDDDIVVKDDRVVAMGGVKEVDLCFEGLRLVLDQKKKGEPKVILDGSIRGRARPGRLLAIMGPSGAGKSTVLHAIAGRIKDSNKLKLHGSRHLNGNPLSEDSLVPAAFIQQDVSFFPYMTVRETLTFRVELKLGSLLSKAARDVMVQELLEELGLERTADTIVGDASVRGISGGERKRLSIAVEMIGSPSAIFLDEPTSGLDSTAATALVLTLRDLADSGKTVVAVIHQPNQHVFSKFDDILLVAEGKQMYFGPRQEVRSYMETYGCKAEDEMGTAEHILDCISRSPIGDETEQEAIDRMDGLAARARDADVNLGKVGKDASKGIQRFTSSSLSGPKANLMVQFRLLFGRSIREIARAKVTIILKLVQQISTALIYGGIYSLGTNQASIQDRFGLLSLIAIGSMNMGLAATIRSFPREKAIVSNEIASNMYRTLPYFVGKAISELPMIGFFNGLFGIVVYKLTGLSNAPGKLWNFLGLLTMHGVLSQAAGLFIGAISPNSDVALAMFPALVVLNIIFDGKNIAEESIPRLLRWIPKVGLIRWGFEGLCINEFTGLAFDSVSGGIRRGPVARTGADALARFGLGTRSLTQVVQAQLNIVAACWILSYIGLTLTRQRFLVMQTSNPNETKE